MMTIVTARARNASMFKVRHAEPIACQNGASAAAPPSLVKVISSGEGSPQRAGLICVGLICVGLGIAAVQLAIWLGTGRRPALKRKLTRRGRRQCRSRRQGLALRHLGPIGARVGLAAGLQQSADISFWEQIGPPPTSVTLAITGSSGWRSAPNGTTRRGDHVDKRHEDLRRSGQRLHPRRLSRHDVFAREDG